MRHADGSSYPVTDDPYTADMYANMCARREIVNTTKQTILDTEKGRNKILYLFLILFGCGILISIILLSVYLYRKFRTKKNKTPS